VVLRGCILSTSSKYQFNIVCNYLIMSNWKKVSLFASKYKVKFSAFCVSSASSSGMALLVLVSCHPMFYSASMHDPPPLLTTPIFCHQHEVNIQGMLKPGNQKVCKRRKTRCTVALKSDSQKMGNGANSSLALAPEGNLIEMNKVGHALS